MSEPEIKQADLEWYRLLEVDRSAENSQIEKKFEEISKRWAREGREPGEFEHLRLAKNTLMDPLSRALHDKNVLDEFMTDFQTELAPGFQEIQGLGPELKSLWDQLDTQKASKEMDDLKYELMIIQMEMDEQKKVLEAKKADFQKRYEDRQNLKSDESILNNFFKKLSELEPDTPKAQKAWKAKLEKSDPSNVEQLLKDFRNYGVNLEQHCPEFRSPKYLDTLQDGLSTFKVKSAVHPIEEYTLPDESVFHKYVMHGCYTHDYRLSKPKKYQLLEITPQRLTGKADGTIVNLVRPQVLAEIERLIEDEENTEKTPLLAEFLDRYPGTPTSQFLGRLFLHVVSKVCPNVESYGLPDAMPEDLVRSFDYAPLGYQLKVSFPLVIYNRLRLDNPTFAACVAAFQANLPYLPNELLDTWILDSFRSMAFDCFLLSHHKSRTFADKTELSDEDRTAWTHPVWVHLVQAANQQSHEFLKNQGSSSPHQFGMKPPAAEVKPLPEKCVGGTLVAIKTPKAESGKKFQSSQLPKHKLHNILDVQKWLELRIEYFTKYDKGGIDAFRKGWILLQFIKAQALAAERKGKQGLIHNMDTWLRKNRTRVLDLPGFTCILQTCIDMLPHDFVVALAAQYGEFVDKYHFVTGRSNQELRDYMRSLKKSVGQSKQVHQLKHCAFRPPCEQNQASLKEACKYMVCYEHFLTTDLKAIEEAFTHSYSVLLDLREWMETMDLETILVFLEEELGISREDSGVQPGDKSTKSYTDITNQLLLKAAQVLVEKSHDFMGLAFWSTNSFPMPEFTVERGKIQRSKWCGGLLCHPSITSGFRKSALDDFRRESVMVGEEYKSKIPNTFLKMCGGPPKTGEEDAIDMAEG
jgi:hypothetical protein